MLVHSEPLTTDEDDKVGEDNVVVNKEEYPVEDLGNLQSHWSGSDWVCRRLVFGKAEKLDSHDCVTTREGRRGRYKGKDAIAREVEVRSNTKKTRNRPSFIMEERRAQIRAQ